MHLLSQVRQICDLHQFGPCVDGREVLLRKTDRTDERPTGSKERGQQQTEGGPKTHFTGSITHTHMQPVPCILSMVHQNVVIVVYNDNDDDLV